MNICGALFPHTKYSTGHWEAVKCVTGERNHTWKVSKPALPFASCVTWGRLFIVSGLWFPQTGGSNTYVFVKFRDMCLGYSRFSKITAILVRISFPYPSHHLFSPLLGFRIVWMYFKHPACCWSIVGGYIGSDPRNERGCEWSHDGEDSLTQGWVGEAWERCTRELAILYLI